MLGGAPDISLGQNYLTTADPFDPNYNTPDQHRDLKKLTCPSTHRQNKKVEGVQSACSICQQRKNWRPKQTAAGMGATRGK